jgi:RNA-directed DNA polymerase
VGETPKAGHIMKRYGNLWSRVTAFDNLLSAAHKAQKAKRFRENVLSFNDNLEVELFQLQRELQSQTYQPGQYHTFRIYESKPRLISAAPYRDRVVHHALCNIIVPIIERTFIGESYANRIGYGSHRGLKTFTQFARQNQYILQCDIQKYFASIDHEILKTELRRKIKCPGTLWLIDTIIDNSNEQEPVYEHFKGDDLLTPTLRRRGIPIGNLTSQFFANVYLNGLDHYIKETLKIARYVRYVDDFALFHDDKLILVEARQAIEDYLDKIRLKIHPIKSQLFETRKGANFLGFRVLPDRIRVRNDNVRKARQRIKQMHIDLIDGKIEQHEIARSMQSWFAHLDHGDTWQLRQAFINQFSWLSEYL